MKISKKEFVELIYGYANIFQIESELYEIFTEDWLEEYIYPLRGPIEKILASISIDIPGDIIDEDYADRSYAPLDNDSYNDFLFEFIDWVNDPEDENGKRMMKLLGFSSIEDVYDAYVKEECKC